MRIPKKQKPCVVPRKKNVRKSIFQGAEHRYIGQVVRSHGISWDPARMEDMKARREAEDVARKENAAAMAVRKAWVDGGCAVGGVVFKRIPVLLRMIMWLIFGRKPKAFVTRLTGSLGEEN